MDQRFARRYRLTKTDEYSSVFGFRKAIRGNLLMLHWLPRPPECSDARLGLVIGKKQLKHAVDRNRVKRIIREQFRLRRASLPAVDLIVRLASKPASLDGKMLADEFLSLLGKLANRHPPRRAG